MKRLITALKERKPWVAAVACLLLDNFFGMLVIGRGGLAVAYLTAYLIASASPFIAAFYGLITLDPVKIWWIPSLFLRVVGAAHAAHVQREARFKAGKWYAPWYIAIILAVILPVALPLAMRSFLFESFNAASGSMRPTLSVQDTFFVSKTAYRLGNAPQRGDVIVFYANSRASLKRIVGLPGDVVQMKKGILFINKKPVIRKYLKEETIIDEVEDNQTYKRYTEALPEGAEHDIYEISDTEMLDNTKAFLVPDNEYFVMGDNRDQSLDSRLVDEMGFVKRQEIIGKATYVYWNPQEKKISWQAIK